MNTELCCAEVRDLRAGGQRACGRIAKVKATRRLDDGPSELWYTMAYCARHVKLIHDIPEGVSQGEVTEIVT